MPSPQKCCRTSMTEHPELCRYNQWWRYRYLNIPPTYPSLSRIKPVDRLSVTTTEIFTLSIGFSSDNRIIRRDQTPLASVGSVQQQL
jgi:hypothetical protein